MNREKGKEEGMKDVLRPRALKYLSMVSGGTRIGLEFVQ